MITAREIVERIKEKVGCEWSEQTVDTFKAGDPDAPVNGIATTFMATVDVLRRASQAGLNFVITHEPTFYNHPDDTSGLAGDAVLAAKQAFLAESGLVVWRFHDHWHRRTPDGILEGVVQVLGWEACQREGDQQSFDLPETTLGELAATMASRLGSRAPRVVGDPAMVVTKVALCPGAAPWSAHLRLLQREDVEVLAVGESREWEAVEYVRDAAALGMKKALVVLGHAASEEPGMARLARWLSGFVGEVPVEFVPAGSPFAAWRP